MIQISLAAVRVNAGLTQLELSEKLEVDRQTVINWEKGYTKMTTPWLLVFADKCNFPVDNISLPIKSTKSR